MPDLYFPQLQSGALAQYPIRKTRTVRTIKNVLADGSMILQADPDGARLTWNLSYTELSAEDVGALQAHFAACAGPLRAFTFIDPTDNMLVSSSDLTNPVWQIPAVVQVLPGMADPVGGSAAVRFTNTGQSQQEILQTIAAAPAGFQYCFSFYILCATESTVTIRRGLTAPAITTVAIGANWRRVVSSGRLADSGTSFTVGIGLAPGQQVEIYGLQLEAQQAPSRYRPTMQSGGVYSMAHWGTDQLVVTAQAPDQFSTSFSIETSISG
jgi:hypothetical protein